MLIGSRSGMMVKNKPNLPYDSEIEYLESTGVEYIDIGQSISNDHTIPNVAFLSCKYKTFTRNGQIIYVNERYSAANWQLRIGDYANAKPDVYFGVNVNSSYGNIGSPTASPKTVKVDMSGVDINSVHYNFSYPETLFFPTYRILLFAYNNTNANTPTTLYQGRVYWFSMFGANGNIDLIPVRKGHVGYMYDKVSKRLFGNSGTGSFILGPDKVGGGGGVISENSGLKHFMQNPPKKWRRHKMLIASRNSFAVKLPIPAKNYIQSGLVAMWDGIENVGWKKHDSSATVWRDLIGNNDITLSAVTTFDDDSFWRANIDSTYAGVFTNSTFSVYSVEIVFNMDSTSRFVARFTPSCFVIISSNGSYVQYASSGNASVKTANFFWGNRVSVSACGRSGTRQCYANGALCSAAVSNSWENAPSGLMNRNVNSLGQASKGHIYNIRLYSRTLTAAEVAANYAVDKIRFNLP